MLPPFLVPPHSPAPALPLPPAPDPPAVAIPSPSPAPDLARVLIELERRSPAEPIDAAAWLDADYSPLPSLVTAARRIFDHEPLPHIRRAQSAGIPQTLAYLTAIAEEARASGGLHLALVTGVPGSGKTLVGLQFVYQTHFAADAVTRQQAVFLSGNGPLVQVLQYALQSRAFVQDVHGFLKHHGGGRSQVPQEHIWVYDEAQRAWDATQVQEKRGHPTSEPEDFLRIGARKSWALMVGLIGEGQEIHVGEEAGLALWNEAIARMPEPWVVHCPAKIAHVFRDATAIHTSHRLDLTVSLRTHLAEDVQDWVASLLEGRLGEAARLAYAGHLLTENGHGLIVQADLSPATGSAERDMGLDLMKRERGDGKGRLTVAADKNYDTKDFVKDLRAMTVTPHVARKDRYSAIDGRTTTWEGYAVSQKKRKLVEEAFGWMKTVGLLAKLRHRGRAKARWVFQFTAAASGLKDLLTHQPARRPQGVSLPTTSAQGQDFRTSAPCGTPPLRPRDLDARSLTPTRFRPTQLGRICSRGSVDSGLRGFAARWYLEGAERRCDAMQGITLDPDVMMGKPVIEGTRITVELVLEELGRGRTIEELLEAHPRLTREGILAAIRFGAEVLRADVSYPLCKSVA